jgi:hypothetical protein
VSTEIDGDDRLIDLVGILELAARSGLISRFERTVSRSYVGWQVWLPSVQGVFELLLKAHELEGLAIGRGTVGHYFRTDLLLKYYPALDEELFSTFSVYERILRQSDVFNGSPTPRGEIKQEIHESYFTVAEVRAAIARDHKAVGISLRSQDQWRETRGSPLSAHDHTGRIWQLPVGSVDRRVPGWRIGMRFFSPLVRAYALRYGSPKLLRLSEAKGRVWRVIGKTTKSRLSNRVLEKRLDVGFCHGLDPLEQKKRAKELQLYLAKFSSGREPLRERTLKGIRSLSRVV